MAITSVQEPAGYFNAGTGGGGLPVILSRGKNIYVATSNNTAQTNFKYLVQIDEDGTQIFEAYVSPNPAGALVFDLSPIVKDRLTSPVVDSEINARSIHNQSNLVTNCEGGQNFYTVNIGEVYEVAGVLTEFPDLFTHTTITINGHQDYKDYFYSAGDFSYNLFQFSPDYSVPVERQKAFLTNIDANTYKNTPYNNHFLVLSQAKIAIPTHQTDLGGLAWIHDNGYITSDVQDVTYTWYDDAGTQLATYTGSVVDPANGGQTLASTDPEGKIQAVPCHWGSMSNATSSLIATFTNAFNWTYYTIQLKQSDTNVANDLWCFYKDCNGNKNYTKDFEGIYQLAWSNGFGFWDYYTFDTIAKHETSASKKQYSTNVGTYSEAVFNLHPFDTGKKNYQVVPDLMWTLSTKKIDENLSQYLKNIIKAREVQLITPEGDVLPVIVETNATEFYKYKHNKLYDFSIKVKLAQTLLA